MTVKGGELEGYFSHLSGTWYCFVPQTHLHHGFAKVSRSCYPTSLIIVIIIFAPC